MKADEFNNKWHRYLEPRHYGCALQNEEAVDYLDKEFIELVKMPGFSFSQIKAKWNYFCFYCTGVPTEKILEIESNLKKIHTK